MLQRTDDSAQVAGHAPGANAYRQAVRHSARVRRLKVLLPVGAVLISFMFIGVSIVRAYLPDNLEIASAKIENGKVVMEKPAISGRNADGVNYSMRAERALQDIKNPNIITLETIAAAVPVNEKVVARVEAIGGVFDRGSEFLNLDKPFTLNLNSGLDAQFNSARLDIKGGTMETSDPVAIQTKGASIVAKSLNIKDKGRTITFTGDVRVDIEPSALRNNGSMEAVKQ
jgi:lipopolysaccharide export system protein LptC